MANVIKVYNNGTTAGKSGMNKNPPKRGKTTGWSVSTSRRMTKWLYSVGINSLSGNGFSFTLTVRDCPPTPEDWQKMRQAFIYRLKRRGLIRLHWLTEWQRRGVPHMHGCAYFSDKNISPIEIMEQWVKVAEKYGAQIRGQDSKIITDTIGWYKYLSKHAVRGVQHYQRNSINMPTHWQNSGRMWGKWGDWDVDEPIELVCDDDTYYKFRRLVRNWRISKARSEYRQTLTQAYALFAKQGFHGITINPKSPDLIPKRKNITNARRLLKSNDVKLSQIRGVNEFLPRELVIDFLIVAKDHEQGDVQDKPPKDDPEKLKKVAHSFREYQNKHNY